MMTLWLCTWGEAVLYCWCCMESTMMTSRVSVGIIMLDDVTKITSLTALM